MEQQNLDGDGHHDEIGGVEHHSDDDLHEEDQPGLLQGRKRKRCAACYRAAEDRRRGQNVKRVLTKCISCEKPFCLNHLTLRCSDCNIAGLPQAPVLLQEQAEERARNERDRQEFETIIERQRRQIDELQQQVRVLVPLVS